jgi:hypothetical protein
MDPEAAYSEGVARDWCLEPEAAYNRRSSPETGAWTRRPLTAEGS